MNTKLTLTINNSVISKAKKYSKQKKVSLSKLVEFYFTSLTNSSTKEPDKLPPITSTLSGLIKAVKVKDDRKILEDALFDKFL